MSDNFWNIAYKDGDEVWYMRRIQGSRHVIFAGRDACGYYVNVKAKGSASREHIDVDSFSDAMAMADLMYAMRN